MTEINNLRTVAGVEYIARQWHAGQVRDTAAHELAELNRAWQALEDSAAGMEPEAVQAEAHRLIADALTAQRSLAVWAGKSVQPPPWKVDGQDVVVGTVRVPLTVATLAEWMQGEADVDA